MPFKHDKSFDRFNRANPFYTSKNKKQVKNFTPFKKGDFLSDFNPISNDSRIKKGRYLKSIPR